MIDASLACPSYLNPPRRVQLFFRLKGLANAILLDLAHVKGSREQKNESKPKLECGSDCFRLLAPSLDLPPSTLVYGPPVSPYHTLFNPFAGPHTSYEALPSRPSSPRSSSCVRRAQPCYEPSHERHHRRPVPRQRLHPRTRPCDPRPSQARQHSRFCSSLPLSSLARQAKQHARTRSSPTYSRPSAVVGSSTGLASASSRPPSSKARPSSSPLASLAPVSPPSAASRSVPLPPLPTLLTHPSLARLARPQVLST